MKLDDLKKLAEAASEIEALDVDDGDVTFNGGSTSWNRTQRNFFRAANPQTILQMIAVMEQMAEALETCKREMQGDLWDALYIDGSLTAYKEVTK